MAVTINPKPGVDPYNQKHSKEDGTCIVSDTFYSQSQKLHHIYDNPTIQGSQNSDSGVRTLDIY